MENQANTKECPALPIWLGEAQCQFEEDRLTFFELPQLIQSSFHLYQGAHKGEFQSAEKLALKFESGDVPSGPNMSLAVTWHRYAAALGSASSALRLAQLLVWAPVYEKNTEESMQLAKRAVENVLGNNHIDKGSMHTAAAAALFLLERNPDVAACVQIEDLLNHKRFAGHPDSERIATALHRISCQAGDDPLSLKVAQSRIVEDGGFKVGIYKCLESPLPLVPLAPDPDAIRTVLDQEFPWFKAVNEQVYRQLVVAQSSAMPAFRIRPLLLAGLPGVGKTTWVKRLAELCKVPCRTVMAAGGADSMFLRGTPRGWSSARPGAVVQAMAIEGVANPLFLVDELEKASHSNHNGRIWDVLLQLLEPASSRTYLDECLQIPCDLSWVSWIATVNTLGALPQPLLERFTVMLVDPPGEGHFMTLVEGAVRGFAKELGMDQRMLPSLDAEDLDILRRCRNPREINRTVQMMIEQRLVQLLNGWRH